MKFFLRLLALVLLLTGHVRAWGNSFGQGQDERITHFGCDLYVDRSGKLTVNEKITVLCAGRSIKRGIYREIPTRYSDRFGNKFDVRFALQKVLCDGQPTRVNKKSKSNGVHLSIGPKVELLTLGLHTYEIEYTVQRCLGFFKQHDELYWNVTGNGWEFAIDKVVATVHLPQAVDPKALQASVYTGYAGSNASQAKFAFAAGKATFESTVALHPKEGLTLCVGWPKGIVTAPTTSDKTYDFVRDNWGTAINLVIIFLMLSWLCAAHRRYRRAKNSIPVFARFDPPRGMLPSDVHYLVKKKYTATALAADIVDIARQGHIQISSSKRFFKTIFTLKKNSMSREGLNPAYKSTFTALFANKQDTLVMDSYKKEVAACASSLEGRLDYGWSRFFDKQLEKKLTTGSVALFITSIFFLYLNVLHTNVFLVEFFACYLFFLVPGLQFLLRVYTPQAAAPMAEIEGFKMFLTVVELDRMKVIGTPPERTPQLYEKYLPYAIALGVERQWAAQFAPIFEQARREGRDAGPGWYRSRSFNARSFSSSLSSRISAASSPPGSRSGLGGGGSSGGGGGGGGGGGR